MKEEDMESLAEMFAKLEDLTDLQPGPKPAPAPTMPLVCEGELATAEAALKYITGGNATITLRSKRTGTRFTYKVRATEDGQMLFVSLLNGPDNENSYQYFGNIRTRNRLYWHGKKARIGPDAPAAKAFSWAWHAIITNQKPEALEIWHEGSCGRCGRKLTVPSSIASGFGPECAGKVGL